LSVQSGNVPVTINYDAKVTEEEVRTYNFELDRGLATFLNSVKGSKVVVCSADHSSIRGHIAVVQVIPAF
jgi:hypothetical protein